MHPCPGGRTPPPIGSPVRSGCVESPGQERSASDRTGPLGFGSVPPECSRPPARWLQPWPGDADQGIPLGGSRNALWRVVAADPVLRSCCPGDGPAPQDPRSRFRVAAGPRGDPFCRFRCGLPSTAAAMAARIAPEPSGDRPCNRRSAALASDRSDWPTKPCWRSACHLSSSRASESPGPADVPALQPAPKALDL